MIAGSFKKLFSPLTGGLFYFWASFHDPFLVLSRLSGGRIGPSSVDRSPPRRKGDSATDPAARIVLLWFAFGLSHVLLSSRGPRARLVAALGDRGFLGLYSLVALATFVPLVSVYAAHRHEGALLWAPGTSVWGFWLVSGVMGVAFVLLVASLLTPSPASMTAPRDPVRSQPTGVHLITRHALFMAFGLFGAVHLIPNGYATDIAFFSGFPIFVVLGSIHQDRRKLEDPASGYPEYYAATPLLPFWGSQSLRGLRGLDWRAVVIGVALAVLVRHYHRAWFG